MELVCKPLMNGIMAYWSEVEKAASYNVTLYINKQAISKRINPRTELYCTFNGLAAIDGTTKNTIISAARSTVHVVGGSHSTPQHSGQDYYVDVVAEDRDGNIIEKSEKVKCTVREF
ncbi:MAG: hypothetical protein IJ008_00805 [Clostridia bacterium]|nr:hypothetical protein [Clostridia bacterium]